MKEEQATYSTGDMLKLINTAATNLVMKKQKVSLEAQVRRQREECDYTRELLGRAQKKIAELDPELREAEERAREAREASAALEAEREALKKERDRLRELQRKAALLERKTAEAAALRGSVAALKEKFDRARSVLDGKLALKGELGHKRRASESAAQELKDRLASLRTGQEKLIGRLAAFDLTGYLELLRGESGALADRVRDKGDLSAPDGGLSLVVACLQSARKVDDLYRIVEEASPEQRSAIAGFEAIKSGGLLAGLREEMRGLVAELAAWTRREVAGLKERQGLLAAEVASGEDTAGRLKADLASGEEALRSEQAFRDSSRAQLEQLASGLSAQTAELERVRKTAERVQMTIETDRAFVEALKPTNDALLAVNKKLRTLFDEYRRAFEPVARACKGETAIP
jgi:chromosome segregation ATPase